MVNNKVQYIPKNSIQRVVIYADGGCPRNGQPGARMFYSFAVFVNDALVHKERVEDVTDAKQTNQVAEWLAIINALEYMAADPKRATLGLEVRSDSETAIGQINAGKRVIAPHIKQLFARFLEVIKKVGVDGVDVNLVQFKWVPREEVAAVLGH